MGPPLGWVSEILSQVWLPQGGVWGSVGAPTGMLFQKHMGDVSHTPGTVPGTWHLLSHFLLKRSAVPITAKLHGSHHSWINMKEHLETGGGALCWSGLFSSQAKGEKKKKKANFLAYGKGPSHELRSCMTGSRVYNNVTRTLFLSLVISCLDFPLCWLNFSVRFSLMAAKVPAVISFVLGLVRSLGHWRHDLGRD